jgi:hypothetical protein
MIEEANANEGKIVSEWDLKELEGVDAAYLDIIVSYFESINRERKLKYELGARGG